MEAAAAVPCASATFGVSASGEWVKALCFDNIRRACGSDAFDEGDESEGKKEGKRGVPWQCPNFMWVNVWNNDIKALSMRMAPRTLYLDCSNNDIRSLDTLQGGQNLVYLDASSNDIGKKGRAGLPPPGSLLMPALEGLNLANNDLGNVPDNGMDWCPNVRAVSLNNNDLKTFTDSPNWGQLQFLNLANNDLRAVPSLARSPYLRQLYLEKNKLADDSVPAICRLIDVHPYLIRLKLGHNRFSKGAIQAIIAHGQMRNPYLFHDGAQLNFANDFSTPMSTYGANGGGARTADATTCWVVPMPAGAPPPFAEAFPVVDAQPVAPAAVPAAATGVVPAAVPAAATAVALGTPPPGYGGQLPMAVATATAAVAQPAPAGCGGGMARTIVVNATAVTDDGGGGKGK